MNFNYHIITEETHITPEREFSVSVAIFNISIASIRCTRESVKLRSWSWWEQPRIEIYAFLRRIHLFCSSVMSDQFSDSYVSANILNALRWLHMTLHIFVLSLDECGGVILSVWPCSPATRAASLLVVDHACD